MMFLASILIGNTVAFLLMSCSTPAEPETPEVEFFPMTVGNKWTYIIEQRDSEFDVEIVGTKMINNQEYFIFASSINFPARDSLYFRAQNENEILLNLDGQDHLFIDFGAPIDAKQQSFRDFTAYVFERDISTSVPAGSFDNCVNISFDAPNTADEEKLNLYAPGVGLVVQIFFKGRFLLKSAKVNGISFP